jgi:hypothetical protein
MVNGTEVLTRKEFWERHDALKDLDNDAHRAEAYKLHRDYWGRYVKAFNIRVHSSDLLKRCAQAVAAGDNHLNSPYTTLNEWDRMKLPQHVVKALRENGEGYSLSVNTCVWKEAARRQLEANSDHADDVGSAA